MLRVAVVNADELVGRGLKAMLTTTQDRVELVDLSPSTRDPVDIALFEMFTIEGTQGQHIADLLRDPRIDKVAVYTWNFQPWQAVIAIKLGASGYLAKGLPACDLVDALLAVHDGETVVLPKAPRLGPAGGEWPGRGQGLTAREAEALTLITMGLSNHEIAQRMGLSINSLKSHIRRCYRKIGAHSRSQAVLWGIAHGTRTEPFDARPSASNRANHRGDPAADLAHQIRVSTTPAACSPTTRPA